MSDLRRDMTARSSRCGRCSRPFDFGEAAYEPGRYSAWTWHALPVCFECSEALEAEANKVTDTDRITLYTVAPPAYDGFSCRELSPDCGADHHGVVIRKVSVERRDLDWLTNRYASGLYAWTTEDEARRFPTIWRLDEEERQAS